MSSRIIGVMVANDEECVLRVTGSFHEEHAILVWLRVHQVLRYVVADEWCICKQPVILLSLGSH